MSHPVGLSKSRFLLPQCSLLCFPFPDHQRVCRFFLFLFSMVPNAESVDLPAIHQHLDRFIRIASAESDESHQRPAVSGAGQLDSKICRVKCAKAPCLREVSHTLVHFGEKEWHRNRSSDVCTFSCFILRRYSSDPRPMNFAVFHRKGATGLRVTSP